MYDINLNNYIYGPRIDGSNNETGSVHIAHHKPTNTYVAIKKYFIDNKESDDYGLIQQEIVTTRQLQHPNVLAYLNAFVSGHDVYVISPLMNYGSCSNLLQESFTSGFPELAIAFIVKDVLHGLDYLHRKGIIHRSLRASHILISGIGEASICGMRYACEAVKSGKWQRTIFNFPKSSTNNLKWLSPELLQQDLRGYNEKSDIYSLGITICELANGIVPFHGCPDTLMLTEKVRGFIPNIIDRSTYQADSMDIDQSLGDETNENSNRNIEEMKTRKFSETFHEIAEQCVQREADNRPSVHHLLKHPFFKQCKRTETTLLDILNPVIPLHERFKQNLENDTMAITDILNTLELESCQWDFENT
ncbi:STE20-related kinase adapter protein alpha [Phymastichus coffea]|uniref:STE20-related kinase adapter protein alpha n=1 Tax=Phymastichus coffea TaxID=108790 RepID=UPI00273C63B8|nr:STE20-related kinase adapter protein alpha [Phymastichus coffea]XP_058797335.1 STE20-related kinase adapter protein alpha [Phymastichus coffea]